MKILLIDTVHRILADLLERDGNVVIDGSSLSRNEILETVKEYEGIVIRSRINIDREIIDRAAKLKFIARAGAGMESIDVNYAEQKGISCLNSPEGNRDAVGEHAIAMLLSLFNNINKADREVRSGKWIREENRGEELKGKTVGIIGYGNMGKSFAEKLKSFECNIIAYDKFKKNFDSHQVSEVSEEIIFKYADILSLHIPLNSQTEYLINSEYINKFRKKIYVINTARGKCVKTDDLVKELKSGKIRGACLDTIEYEETSFEKFNLRSIEHSESWQYLIHSDKVVLSPHIAGWTFQSHETISTVLYEKISSLKVQ